MATVADELASPQHFEKSVIQTEQPQLFGSLILSNFRATASSIYHQSTKKKVETPNINSRSGLFTAFPKTSRKTTAKGFSLTKLVKTDRGVEKNAIKNSSPAKTNLEKLNERKSEHHHTEYQNHTT